MRITGEGRLHYKALGVVMNGVMVTEEVRSEVIKVDIRERKSRCKQTTQRGVSILPIQT